MTLHAFRLHLFLRAREPENVSAACRELGIARERLSKKLKRLRLAC